VGADGAAKDQQFTCTDSLSTKTTRALDRPLTRCSRASSVFDCTFWTQTCTADQSGRDSCDGGDGHRLLLWSVKAVMPQAKGVLPGDIPIRGAQAQRCATVRPGNKVCRVCGSYLALWASGPKAQSLRTCAGWRLRRRCEPWCVPGLQVCTRPHENGQGRKLNAGAGLRLIRRTKPLNRPQ
jgi:hypothetical protein